MRWLEGTNFSQVVNSWFMTHYDLSCSLSASKLNGSLKKTQNALLFHNNMLAHEAIEKMVYSHISPMSCPSLLKQQISQASPLSLGTNFFYCDLLPLPLEPAHRDRIF